MEEETKKHHAPGRKTWSVDMPEDDYKIAQELYKKSGYKNKIEYTTQILTKKKMMSQFDKEILDKIDKIIYEIKKIGVNVNQLAYQANKANQVEEEKQLNNYLDDLMKKLADLEIKKENIK